MFCNKCGKELPDNATFCSGCGNQVGAAPAAAPAAPSSLPPILSRLVSQLKNFFTKKDPIGVVAHSAKDNSFSGAILLGFSILISALACMINFNQTINYLISDAMGGKIPGELMKYIQKFYPSGTTFGMSLLASVVISAAAIGMVYVGLKVMNKKNVSISGVINLVAYASIPLTCVFIANMLVGLIWMPLAIVLTFLAAVASLLILYSAFIKAGEFEKTPYGSFLLVAGALTVVIILFTYIWINSGMKAISDNLLGILFGGLGL